VLRLLERIRERSSDPELYAGLVHACRYVGLLDASIAAFHRASRLDPSIRTSVAHSFLMNGDFEKAIAADVDDPAYITMLSLQAPGREQEILDLHRSTQQRSSGNVHLVFVVDAVAAAVEGNVETGLEAVRKLRALPTFTDPEGLYLWARASAALGDADGALEMAALAVDTGLHRGKRDKGKRERRSCYLSMGPCSGQPMSAQARSRSMIAPAAADSAFFIAASSLVRKASRRSRAAIAPNVEDWISRSWTGRSASGGATPIRVFRMPSRFSSAVCSSSAGSEAFASIDARMRRC
jgi:hypothetical protein